MPPDPSQRLTDASPNFGCLRGRNAAPVQAAVAAERFVFDDSVSALMRLRQFGELLAQEAAAKAGLYSDASDSQLDFLRRLSDRGLLPREVAELFHDLRRTGNAATHQAQGTRRESLHQLKMARTLAVWYERSFGGQRSLRVIQVKRVRSNVNRPVIDALRGSLHRFEADRGTIIATSGFSPGTIQASREVGAAPITLIDGSKLLDLMIEHGIGVRKKSVETLGAGRRSLGSRSGQ